MRQELRLLFKIGALNSGHKTCNKMTTMRNQDSKIFNLQIRLICKLELNGEYRKRYLQKKRGD
jgi:hypothetical protein